MAPFDREGALKRAEKALRLGRVDAAIEEYQGIVLAQPRDWNSANALGDLFVRSGQLDKGVEQYTRIADHLAEEGFYPKASALYKKILKVKPTEEYALIRSGDVAAKLGPARRCQVGLPDGRRPPAQGRQRARRRRDGRAPRHHRPRGLRRPLRRRQGRPRAGRRRDRAARAARCARLGFEEKARHELARAAYRDILELQPGDEDARARVLAANIATGEFSSAFALASSPDGAAPARGRAREPPVSRPRCWRCGRGSPTSIRPTSRRGSGWCAAIWAPATPSRRAATCRSRPLAQDPSLWMALAEAELRQGRFEDGRAAVASALAANPAPARSGHRDGLPAGRTVARLRLPRHRGGDRRGAGRGRLRRGGRGPARVRHPRAPPHRGADAAGRDLRRRRPRGDDVLRPGAAGRRLPRRRPRPRSAHHQRGPGGARAVGPRQHRALPARPRDAGRSRPGCDHRRPAERRQPVHGHRQDGPERRRRVRRAGGARPAPAPAAGPPTRGPDRRPAPAPTTTAEAAQARQGRARAARGAAAEEQKAQDEEARRRAAPPGPHLSRHGHGGRRDPVARAGGAVIAAALRGGLAARPSAHGSRRADQGPRLVRAGGRGTGPDARGRPGAALRPGRRARSRSASRAGRWPCSASSTPTCTATATSRSASSA